MRTRTVLKDAAIVPVAGYLGTKVMEPVASKLYQLESEEARRREDAARPGPPYEIAAEKSAKLLGLELNEQQRKRAGLVFHYGLAISWVPVYMLMRRRLRMTPVGAGLASGAAMSLTVDEGLTPALGFSAPNRAYPLVTHLRAFAAHLVFGLAVAGATEAGWRLMRQQRPS